MNSACLLLAKLGSDDGELPMVDPGFFPLASVVLLRLTVLSFGAAGVLLALGYGFYFLQTLPWRRRERAVVMLDLLDVGLRQGQSPEQALILLSGTRDRTLPVRLHLLAANLESGLTLPDALARAPRLLPPAVQTLFELGARHGVLPRLLPACRAALDEPPAPRVVAVQQIAFFFILSAAQCLALLGLLGAFVAPKFQMILEEMAGLESGRLNALMSAAFWISGTSLLIGGVLALWMFARIGGPRLLEGPFVRPWAIWDWMLRRVPWRRLRMRRNFTAALAVLLDCGLPEPIAVREAALVTGSRWFEERSERVTNALAHGESLTDALTTLDDAGELRWRLNNARHGRAGFLVALRGWLASLETRAHAQEQAAAQGFVTVGLLVQGLAVGLVVTGLFGALVQLTEGALNW